MDGDYAALDLSLSPELSLSDQQGSGGSETSTPQRKKISFYNDFSEGTCGVLDKAEMRTRKGDFAVRILSFVEARENTGYFCKVKRQMDALERYDPQCNRTCYIKTSSFRFVWRFIEQLNYSFGSGGMACAFNEKELSEFIPYIRDIGPKPLPQLKAATHSGRQKSPIWVMNGDIQITSDGLVSSPEESGYVWLDESHMSDTKNSMADTIPMIVLPLTSRPLEKFVRLLQCFKHNALSSLLTVAGSVMAFHYEQVRSTWSGCPVTVAFGPPETGKSTAIVMALSLMGIDESCKYVSGSIAFFLEKCCSSTLPFGIDDPPKPNSKATLDPADVIISVFNRGKTSNMKTKINPISIPIFASNFNISSDRRVSSRALVIPFEVPSVGPTNAEEDELFEQLENSLHAKEFSSCVGWVVRMGQKLTEEGRQYVTQMRTKLRDRFSSRACTNWCVLLFFLCKLLEELKECQSDVEDELCEIEMPQTGMFKDMFPVCDVSKVMETAVSFIRSLAGTEPVAIVDAPSAPTTKEEICASVQKVASYAMTLELSEVLKFMRSDTSIDKEAAVAIYLPLVGTVISEREKQCMMKVKLHKMGGIDARDLQMMSTRDDYIDKTNSKRKKCVLVYLSKLNKELVTSIIAATRHKKRGVHPEAKEEGGKNLRAGERGEITVEGVNYEMGGGDETGEGSTENLGTGERGGQTEGGVGTPGRGGNVTRGDESLEEATGSQNLETEPTKRNEKLETGGQEEATQNLEGGELTGMQNLVMEESAKNLGTGGEANGGGKKIGSGGESNGGGENLGAVERDKQVGAVEGNILGSGGEHSGTSSRPKRRKRGSSAVGKGEGLRKTQHQTTGIKKTKWDKQHVTRSSERIKK